MVGQSSLAIDFRVLEKAELPTMKVEDLRHVCARLMPQEGLHPKVVQGPLGHAGMNTTMDLYSHVMPGMQRDAVLRVGRLIRAHAGPIGPEDRKGVSEADPKCRLEIGKPPLEEGPTKSAKPVAGVSRVGSNSRLTD